MKDRIFVDGVTVFVLDDESAKRMSKTDRLCPYLLETPARMQADNAIQLLKERPIVGQYSDLEDFVKAYENWVTHVRRLVEAVNV